MNDSMIGRLEQAVYQLDDVAKRLAAQKQPGHIYYISQADAARIIATAVSDIWQIIHDAQAGE